MYSCLVLPPYAIFPGLSLVNTGHSQSHSNSWSCKLVWVMIPLKICPSNLVYTIFLGGLKINCVKNIRQQSFLGKNTILHKKKYHPNKIFS